jgi:hypothetical protein
MDVRRFGMANRISASSVSRTLAQTLPNCDISFDSDDVGDLEKIPMAVRSNRQNQAVAAAGDAPDPEHAVGLPRATGAWYSVIMSRPASKPLLDRDTVEVRWLALDQIKPEHGSGLERMLDDAELARADRFRFERDRSAFVAAHALVRTMLSAHAPYPPLAWRFSTSAHGKPEIIRPAGSLPLRFNLSQTRPRCCGGDARQ